ncbi:interaptin-like [Schistocerca gregaria]|uniref:interaptin-like n=1 Tax=Schistocerca gregaria TaxID=7010 RepID=UPI00211EBB86|nr:interaptin-like [Schistocerca gregaria]
MHCSELEDQYKELKYLFDKLTQERDDFQKQLGETQEILEKKIRAEEQMNSEVEELVEKNSVLQENINELEKELEESRRSLSLCESSERHFKEVWEHEVVCRSQLEKELQEVRIEMEEKLGSIADEMQDMSQKAEELKQLCSSLDDQLVEKDREISQFENTIREGIIQYSRLEEDKRSIEGTLRYVQIELDDLRLEKENLEMERDTLRQEKYRFEEGMKILEYEKERWEVEKLDMQYERNKLEQNNIMLEDSNVKLVQEKEILEHNNRELTQEKEGLNIEKDQVIQEKNKLSMEKENLEREMDAIIREKHSIEEERDQLKKQIDVLNVELESLRGLYEMSNKDLRALEEEWKNFKRQEELTRESLEANNRLGIVELKKKMVDLIQEKDYLIREKELELSYLEREKEGLVVELKEKNEELKRIQDLLEELKIKSVIEKEQNQKENMEQQNRIQELEIQVGEIVKGYDNMKCEFRRCTEELENLLNVNTELESENVNLKNQKKDLENELNDKRMEYADTQLRQMKLEMDSEYELEVRKNMERAKKQETNMKISEVKRKSKGHNKTVDKEHHLGYSKRKPSQASLTPKTTLSAKKVNPLDFIISESLSDKMPSSTKQESQSKAFSSRSVQSHKKDSRPLKFGVKLPKNPDREKKALETSDGIFNNDDDPFAFID